VALFASHSVGEAAFEAATRSCESRQVGEVITGTVSRAEGQHLIAMGKLEAILRSRSRCSEAYRFNDRDQVFV
jgi:hypothetical protein